MNARETAATTPKSEIESGSPEEAYQSINKAKMLWGFKDRDVDAWANIIVSWCTEPYAWKRIPEIRPYGSLRRMVESEVCNSYSDFFGFVGKVVGTKYMLMISEAEAGKQGGANNLDGINQHTEVNDNNIIINQNDKPQRESSVGTSTPATMRRLKKDAPEQLERVLAGEITPNKAMVEAGLRVPPFQMPQDPMKAGRYLAQRVDREWMEAMIRAYDDSCG